MKSNTEQNINSLKETIKKNTADLPKLKNEEQQLLLQTQKIAHEISQIKNSISWKITHPLRRASFILKNRKPFTASIKRYFMRNIKSSLSEKSESKIKVVFILGEPYDFYKTNRANHLIAAARQLDCCVSVINQSNMSSAKSSISKANLIFIFNAIPEHEITRILNYSSHLETKIVFDTDTLFFEPAILDTFAASYAFKNLDTHNMRIRMPGTLKMADFCTTSNEIIAQHIRSHRKPCLVFSSGFNEEMLENARLAVRNRLKNTPSKYIRLGYIFKSTNTCDNFKQISEVILNVLTNYQKCKLIIFYEEEQPKIDFAAIPEFHKIFELKSQIEWKQITSEKDFFYDLSEIDINLIPINHENLLSKTNAEPLYIQASLMEIPSIVTETFSYRKLFKNKSTGFFANNYDEWNETLELLINDGKLRKIVGKNSFYQIFSNNNPEKSIETMRFLIDQLYLPPYSAAQAFSNYILRQEKLPYNIPVIADYDILFMHDNLNPSKVSIIMPLYNYSQFVVEALNSINEQTLTNIDLIIVDDNSTDNSVAVAYDWLNKHLTRFNRIVLAKNKTNSGLALTRNAGFSLTETPYVLPLDADNMLLPQCAKLCLEALSAHPTASFAYPYIQQFDAGTELMGTLEYYPARFIYTNYIDAMALIKKSAWASVGGYHNMFLGLEDYDLWCKFVEFGFYGISVPKVLAKYRVHANSMLQTLIPNKMEQIRMDMEERHPWLNLWWRT